MRPDEKITRVIAIAEQWCDFLDHFGVEPSLAETIRGLRQAVPTMRRILDEKHRAGALRAFVKDPVNRRLTADMVTGLRHVEATYFTPEYETRAAELGLTFPVPV